MEKNKDIQIPMTLTYRIGDSRVHMVRALVKGADKRGNGAVNWQRFLDRMIEERFEQHEAVAVLKKLEGK